mmetsp:Transcript_7552/g.18370  ORF Transcript_7552/g.18370 Transcript_7552/m.18370 type:complete len:82 (-) Transcript_7552:169-414(-)
MDAGLLIEGFKILKHWAIAKAGKDVVKRMKFVHFVRFLGEAIQSQSISMKPESHIFELYCRALAYRRRPCLSRGSSRLQTD